MWAEDGGTAASRIRQKHAQTLAKRLVKAAQDVGDSELQGLVDPAKQTTYYLRPGATEAQILKDTNTIVQKLEKLRCYCMPHRTMLSLPLPLHARMRAPAAHLPPFLPPCCSSRAGMSTGRKGKVHSPAARTWCHAGEKLDGKVDLKKGDPYEARGSYTCYGEPTWWDEYKGPILVVAGVLGVWVIYAILALVLAKRPFGDIVSGALKSVPNIWRTVCLKMVCGNPGKYTVQDDDKEHFNVRGCDIPKPPDTDASGKLIGCADPAKVRGPHRGYFAGWLWHESCDGLRMCHM
jgi:hypothetical protein